MNSPTARRTALVTGASSGIGAAVAAELVRRGYRVYGTSRGPESVADPVPGVEYLPLDLTDDASVEACATAAGDVDVLVNNAGESQSGPFEELPADAVERLFRINVFGAVRLTQILLPGMRARRYGRVVMVGSMLASFPLAYRSSYVASKAALRGFADALRREVSPYGVGVTTVEPGSINTGISERRTQYLEDGSPYAAEYRTMLDALNANEAGGISAGTVARTVVRAVEADPPRPLYAVGSNAPVVFALRRLFPRSAVLKLVARRHGLR
ncbi:SDR family oxidoreductase [Nocardiopsis quinghaiensis]|uniref:SDR family oxidoreductase n=1 Tax=Nocardiopsis quinghaiensis TaxID=464995 RepID=UPI001238D329|nr:SDR family oxidoreductase [Nocardiopsis quinghaiensis]